MRVSEACDLRWDDLDLAKRTVIVGDSLEWARVAMARHGNRRTQGQHAHFPQPLIKQDVEMELVTHDETWRIAADGLTQIDQILARIAFCGASESNGEGDLTIRQTALVVAIAAVSASVNRPPLQAPEQSSFGPPESKNPLISR